MLPAGWPMIQLVPIRRDALLKEHAVRASTEDELAEQEAARHGNYHVESTYRNEWRVKK